VRDNGRIDRPALVLVDGIGCAGYVWKYVRAAFDRDFRVIHAHHRGHGASDVPADLGTMTIEQLAADLWAVLDALGVERATLWGHSMGVQVILTAAAAAPGRVRALLPTCGAFERPLDTFHGSDAAARVLPYVRRAVLDGGSRLRRIWRAVLPTELSYLVAVATEVNGRMIRRGDFLPYLDHMASMDPRVFVTLLDAVASHSARPLLAGLDHPALVIAGSDDHFTPCRLAEELAGALPRGELLVIPGGSHVAPLENPRLVELRARRFLAAAGVADS
jgi:pimeloyl-ACP methyl ester carboxylesterase